MIELSLPYPPSVNRIWRRRAGGGMFLANEYTDWIKRADAHFLSQKRILGKIKGAFNLEVTMDRNRRRNSDLDNRLKTILDALQRWGLIENDRLAEKITIEWGEAPEGCKVKLQGALNA